MSGLRLLLVEDEAPARERLVETLARVEPEAVVVGAAGSVREAAEWLASNPPPDLALLDVQLADGLSFELFARMPPPCPVVFATAYDGYLQQAFDANAIDYLLKPVADAALARAFANYRRLQAHFGAEAQARAVGRVEAATTAAGSTRQRLVARQGSGYALLRADAVSHFVSLDKTTWAIGLDGRRHAVDAPLADLEADLGDSFFRLSRQVLVAASAVRAFRPLGKGRLAVDVAPDGTTLQVPQERAAAFRAWLDR